MAHTVDEIKKSVKEDFLPVLRKKFDDLESLVLYGSAVKGSFVEGVSDVNLLVLTKETHPDRIIELGKESAKLIRRLRLSLHFLTVDEFLNSADVFPMEYFDIQQDHEILWGQDPAEKLQLSKKELRHQLEERLRGSVNGLRQSLLSSQGREKAITQTLIDLSGAQAAQMRAALRLIDHSEIPKENRRLFEEVGRAFDLDGSAMIELLQLRETGKTDSAADIAAATLRFLTALTRKIDSLSKES
ncbi:MAG TPA: nucleotidyltransferase domain-containing protein [Sediminispirochaeta sp.]|nr:nucleotidyltransferase domain-containing protein [Sediminispirochaeta sp.]